MKNKEFWKDTIYDILCEGSVVAIDKRTQEPRPCSYADCGQCLFGGGGLCVYGLRKWLEQEHIEPILNDAEKHYLESVLYPFRNRVKHITKNRFNMHQEYLSVGVIDRNSKVLTYTNFPHFEKETMYIGMEPDREYTLAELGLFAEESKVADSNNGKESE